MKKILLSLLASVVTIAISCGVAWLGGYGFNSRGIGVALYALASVVYAVLAFAFAMTARVDAS